MREMDTQMCGGRSLHGCNPAVRCAPPPWPPARQACRRTGMQDGSQALNGYSTARRGSFSHEQLTLRPSPPSPTSSSGSGCCSVAGCWHAAECMVPTRCAWSARKSCCINCSVQTAWSETWTGGPRVGSAPAERRHALVGAQNQPCFPSVIATRLQQHPFHHCCFPGLQKGAKKGCWVLAACPLTHLPD